MVKWDSQNDQLLLLKILETSDAKFDPQKIAQYWPDTPDRPTARAITERLVKIRQTAKANGHANHFSVSNAKTEPGHERTPRKNIKPSMNSTGAGVKKNSSTGKNTKVKKPAIEIEDNDFNDENGPATPTRISSAVKREAGLTPKMNGGNTATPATSRSSSDYKASVPLNVTPASIATIKNEPLGDSPEANDDEFNGGAYRDLNDDVYDDEIGI